MVYHRVLQSALLALFSTLTLLVAFYVFITYFIIYMLMTFRFISLLIQMYKGMQPVQYLNLLNVRVKDINNWMIQNKLKLNTVKTEFFIACSHHREKRPQHLSLPLDGTATMLPFTEVRNLGVVFDRHMSMSNHITSLCKSTYWQIRNINRIRRFIDFDTCANTVRALILSRLDYCNLLLNNITQKDLTRLQKLQNECARLIYQQLRSCHVTPLLTELHWLSVAERITFKTLLCVNKSLTERTLSPVHVRLSCG